MPKVIVVGFGTLMEMIDYYHQGNSTFAVAEKFGLSQGKVMKVFKTSGIKLRSPGNKPGFVHTEETKAKLCGRSGKANTPEAEAERVRKSAESRRGGKRSQETKDRVSTAIKALHDSGHYQQFSRGCSDEARSKISNKVRDLWSSGHYEGVNFVLTPEARERQRQTLIEGYRQGRLTAQPHVTGVITFYKGIRMRSRTEARFAELLDEEGISWIYEPKRLDLGCCTYLPDFFLPEGKVWVEVKGFWDDRSIHKVARCRELGYNLATADYEEIWNYARK